MPAPTIRSALPEEKSRPRESRLAIAERKTSGSFT